MKLVTKIFIGAQVLDIITTIVGVNYLGMTELNPIANSISLTGFILLKIIIASFVAWVMEILKYYKILWIFPIEAGIFPVFNLIQIMLYFLCE